MKIRLFCGAILLTFFAASCSYRVVDFTLVSSKNVELYKFPTYQRGTSRVEGKDTKPIIIIFPTGKPNGKEALDRAIESVPGAIALLDGTLVYKWFYIPYIYGQQTYIVEGTPLIDPAIARAEKLENFDDYSVCLLDRKGKLLKSISLGEEKYYALRDEIFNSPKRAYRNLIK